MVKTSSATSDSPTQPQNGRRVKYRYDMIMSSKMFTIVFLSALCYFSWEYLTPHAPGVNALRNFRSYSNRHLCEMSQDANFPFAYTKYPDQEYESKGRTNSNLQDFRHPCGVLGGQSKCYICEEIECASEKGGYCHLQLQGVDYNYMSTNIPVLSDTAWAVDGRYKHDYGGPDTSHFCTFLSGGDCLQPSNIDYSNCVVRCFGYGYSSKAKPHTALARSLVDQYPGMNKWPDDGKIDLWEYPRNCEELGSVEANCSYDEDYGSPVPTTFNPQGFTITVTGSGEQGFNDGSQNEATFNGPEDVAVDEFNNIYVADTKNHAIRKVFPDGSVITIAGKGPDNSGYEDGPCSSATFANPKGLDVITLEDNTTVIIVADTGNHRIRRIDYNEDPYSCNVRCHSGLCGNNTLSESLLRFEAPPQTGFADGQRYEARYSSPLSIAFLENGLQFAVADSGNFLVRIVYTSNGTVSTLAGTVVDGPKDADGKPQPGCTPPCMVGKSGFNDGDLWDAEFYNLNDITRGPNNTLWIVDEMRVRILELPGTVTELSTIRSMGRVSTIAGQGKPGHEDGAAEFASFSASTGIFVTEDNIAYVADLATCRIRRVTPYPQVAEEITCDAILSEYVRPSGCTSFDQPIDAIGRKGSRVERNVQYNIDSPYGQDIDRGKYIKNCVGVPPKDRLMKVPLGNNLVIDDLRAEVNEDSEQGTSILLKCTQMCTGGIVRGSQYYSDDSSICEAALHDGKINPNGGIIQIYMQRRDSLNISNNVNFTMGSIRNGITSTEIPQSVDRVFRIERYNVSNFMVHTVAGHPSAPLEEPCGYEDQQPAQAARFNRPSGIAARYGQSLTDKNLLIVADTGNNRLRAVSAVCTQICENGGRCIGPDTCSCPTGWTGVDCTKPICTTPCGASKVCTSPDTCTCKPGFTGAACTTATCVQTCYNGGSCSSPDTCSCMPGWFDTNCTTPVCINTCANGGNCTAPNTCACPGEWSGDDCRIPVCSQTCQNGGICIAPNTCQCGPQWSNYDCSAPVCDQGYFVANQYKDRDLKYPRISTAFETEFLYKPVYKNCNLEGWCNTTNEMECDQIDIRESHTNYLNVPFGPEHRYKTGRRDEPNQCMNIELPINYKIPFDLIRSDGTTTGHNRYSPNSQYTSDPANSWRGYLDPTKNQTGPWVYVNDRQVAYVQWVNISQGLYVCANGGSCISPSVCSCAKGWIGFDCRTPVCSQGFYKSTQEDYVSGLQTAAEVAKFSYAMDNRTDKLDWPYSNPTYTVEYETYLSESTVIREDRLLGGASYQTIVDGATLQGGYRCSIRAKTPWESDEYMHQHANFFSRYMDKELMDDGKYYTYWEMGWTPTHRKSVILDRNDTTVSPGTIFIYTNEGYRRWGVWTVTGQPWLFGVCIIEFRRNCTNDRDKQLDLRSGLYDAEVQDTDRSFRPQITYDDKSVKSKGRWKETPAGQCIDEVIRGCANNSTCIDVDLCKCAPGWTGQNCQEAVCTQVCQHNGNCTNPDICTCENGWKDYDCSQPICAQECNNGGVCVAPDTCNCYQWESIFRDGRDGGGVPLFQDYTGDPTLTGWTGFDCATPICVQATSFNLNTKDMLSDEFIPLGGQGATATKPCTNQFFTPSPRCPAYNPDDMEQNTGSVLFVTGNSGTTFQTGCGLDPYETGCCVLEEAPGLGVTCYLCDEIDKVITANTFYCEEFKVVVGLQSEIDSFLKLKVVDIESRKFKECGKYHAPRDYEVEIPEGGTEPLADRGEAKYFQNAIYPWKSNFNFKSNFTSNKFLCNVDEWIQGDYKDNAGLGDMIGVNTVHGLNSGRHVRVNTPNMIQLRDGTWQRGPIVRGEGIFACANRGSCIGPDVCTCADGFTGFDCQTPQCRHLQKSNVVSGCLNGGICVDKDNCVCIQTGSVLYLVHPESARGITGWTGSDCSLPMCVQGFYDPYCTDLEQAPGGEGCYRCANGGNCTAPDICTCKPGWTGFDCRTPVCEHIADPLTRLQIGTYIEDRVIDFEYDPCALSSIYGMRGWQGRKYYHGNCTQPNECTCLCKVPYLKKPCKKVGENCDGPWQDDLVKIRNVLDSRGDGEFTFGSTDCHYGYEGNVHPDTDKFTTCHQTIYRPTDLERASLILIIVFSIVLFFAIVGYRYASVMLKRRYLLAKIERRRSKRSSEESLLDNESGAFRTS